MADTRVAPDDVIERAICRSEIAGSGHSGSEEYDEEGRMTRACYWHTAEGNAHVRRFLAVLREEAHRGD